MAGGFYDICPDGTWVLSGQPCPDKKLARPVNWDKVKDLFPDRNKSNRDFRDPTVTEDPGITLDPKVAIDSLNEFLTPIRNLTDKAADAAGLDDCGFCRFVRGLLPWLLVLVLVLLVRKFLKR